MRFHKGNQYKYGQDMAQWVGIPAGVDFSVTRFKGACRRMFTLVAPGYGDLSAPNQYGNGALYVWGLTPQQAKRFGAAAKEKSCWGGGKGKAMSATKTDDQDEQQRIDEIRQRVEAASEGLWGGTYCPAADGGTYYVRTTNVRLSQYIAKVSSEMFLRDAKQIQADGDFIAKARGDIPWLLARLAERGKRIAELEELRKQAMILAEAWYRLMEKP